MEKKSWLYKVTAWVVTLSLLLQMFPFWPGMIAPRPAVAESGGEAASESLPQGVAGALPDALAQPISISRAQSTYQAGGSVVITYTVTNNQPPTLFPDISETATFTETAQTLAAFDQSHDPNVVRDVMVAVDLTELADYQSASPPASRQDGTLLWTLGDIPPQGQRSFSLTISPPAAAEDFVVLDAGAVAYGLLKGRSVSAQAGAITLAPDGFEQWLIWTIDADIYDDRMLSYVAGLEADAAALFHAARAFDFEAYAGSLRGTRGTLWSEAGNAVDQSSLLIAMLRSQGIPARYRHGSLSESQAQQLILSMFPTPTAILGHIPPGTEVSDPANDAALIAEVQDHWWVEAYLPGQGWTDLDPSFADAEVGDIFAVPTTGGTDRIAELPDAIRHKVHLTLEVEEYHAFPIGGANLQRSFPLAATLNAPALAGRPLNVGFIVNSESVGGLVYGTVIHTYTPFIDMGVGIPLIYGEPFADVLTNFPLASSIATGVWLEVTTETPDGQAAAYNREIKDRIGVDARLYGGDIELPPLDENTPFLSSSDLIQVQVTPHSSIPAAEVIRTFGKVTTISSELGSAAADFTQLDLGDEDSSAVVEWIFEHAATLQESQWATMELLGVLFYAKSTSPNRMTGSETALVKSYPATPKLLLMSQTAITETMQFSFELLNLRERALAYPGQSEDAVVAANLARTVGDKAIEYDLLQQFSVGQIQSAYKTFQLAVENGTALVFITSSSLNDLEPLPISSEAKARITQAVLDGRTVFVPAEPVEIDGEPFIGWLEVDESGHASFVNEQGWPAATAVEYAVGRALLLFGLGHGAAVMAGFVATVVMFLAGAMGLITDAADKAIGIAVEGLSDKWPVELIVALLGAVSLVGNACVSTGVFAGDCVEGVFAAGAFIGSFLFVGGLFNDPPLQPMLFERRAPSEPQPSAAAAITVDAVHSGNNLLVLAETAHASLLGPAAFSWSDSQEHGFTLTGLTADTVDLYAGDTWLASGALTVNELTEALVVGDSLTFSLEAEGSHTYYAPAVNGLAAGSEWQHYSAALAGDEPFTITFLAADATINGDESYDGLLTAVVSGEAQISGHGDSPLPHFTADVTATLADGGLLLGPLDGTVSVDGQTVTAANGLAVGDFSGPVAISESSPAADLVAFNGAVDFFTLQLDPEASAAQPGQPVNLDIVVEANFNDVYTATVAAPAGWITSVNEDGVATATAPASALPGEYQLLVTVQSSLYPRLLLSAVHAVTITEFEGVEIAVVEDELITIPMGPIADTQVEYPSLHGHLVDGRAEIAGAAHTIIITNTSNMPHTFDLSVSGLPAGWTILSNAGRANETSLSLGPGAVGQVGLYIDPTVTDLLPAGQSYPVNVAAVAQNNPSLTAADDFTFAMPGLAFPYPQSAPDHQFVMVGEPVAIEVTMTNVGNIAGSFPVTLTMPTSVFNGTPLPSTLIVFDQQWETAVLPPQQSETQTVVLTTTNTTPGQTYFLKAHSVAGEYEPAVFAGVTIVSEIAGPIFIGAQEAAESCRLNEPALSAALGALALAVTDLEVACDSGDCPLALRDQVVAAAEQAATYGRLASPLVQTYTELETAAAELAGAETDTAIMDALPGITAAVINLTTEVCAISQHWATLRLTPWMDAALPGQTASYDLAVTNRGALTTTYAVTVSLPAETLTFQQTIAPGATENTAVPVASDDLGLYLLTAEVKALDAPIDYLTANAEARLNVVDRFVQVTQVTANPPFVETGESSTTLQIEIANIAGIGLSSEVETAVYAPNGDEMWSDALPLQILGGAPRLYDLAEVDTSGWAAGVYTITANLLLNGQPTAGGDGYGYLSVGQAVLPSHAVHPELVAPGTITVTTSITTEINQSSVAHGQSSMVNESRRYTIYDAPYWNVQEMADRPFLNVEETGSSEAPAASLPLGPVTRPEVVEETAVDPFLMEEEAEELRPLTYTPPDIPDAESSDAETADPQAKTAVDETEEAIESPALSSPGNQLTVGDSFFRVEQDDEAISYTGSWSNVNHSRASGGSYWRSAAAGSTAELAFDGDWLNVGFIGTHRGGYVDISINGDSQGLFDLYRREDNTPLSFVFADLGAGPHTVTMTVTGDNNPFSLGTRVQLDYIDYWDGTPLGDGLFEEDDERVLRSGGWTDVTYANASGGSYMRGNVVAAWFPFDGDSFTYHALAYNGARYAHLFVDGQYLDTVNLYHTGNSLNPITRTFSYDGFGPGPHILQIQSYRNQTTVDALQTPGVGPFIDPDPTPGSVNRYEEDHPAIRYNGVPYTQTAQSWSRHPVAAASDGQYLRSQTAGDTISFDFEGSWLNLGFYGDRFSGYAEIFIDGDSQGVVDLYRREGMPLSFFFPDLTPGSHTVTVTVLGSSNPFAGNNRVQFDYLDFGDGTGLDHGTFEEDDARILRNATGWTTESNDDASGGSFIRSGSDSAWFYFEGDSFTYHAMAYNLANRARLYINGQYLDTVDLFHSNNMANAITRAFSYEGFGPGPHLLQISAYRGHATLDAITTPGVGPFIDLNPPLTGVTRIEEDHPTIRYNGAPFTQTASSWTRVDSGSATRASDGQYIHSSTAGDTISFDFEGSWIGVGFATNRFGGQAEIAIDGEVMSVVDLYTRADDTQSVYFNDLGEGAHTITITVLGTSHPNASNTQVYFDFFDIWDGQPLADGHFEETDERIFYSAGWGISANADASGGAFASSGMSNSTAWFPFTGDSITYQGWSSLFNEQVDIRINGVSQGMFDMYSYDSGPRAYSFDNLGPGPHVMEIRRYRNAVTLDALTTPAVGAPYEPPPAAPIVRYEEDHPAMRYDGDPYRTVSQDWAFQANYFSSGGHNVSSSAVGSSWQLEFEGEWLNVGFRSTATSGTAEIFIDGVSQGLFDTSGGLNNVISFPFGDLEPGPHTVEAVVVSGTVMPDYMDVWDGQPIADGWYDAQLENEASGLFHFGYKRWWLHAENQYAHNGDYLYNFASVNNNIWFTFVGTDLTILGHNRANTSLHVIIDGVYQGEFDMTPQFSQQPYALHFPDLGEGAHVVQALLPSSGLVTSRIDAFEVNPDGFYSYTPQITWYDATGTEELDPGFTHTGFVTTIGIGDLNGDGNVELVAPGLNGRLYVYRGDGQDTGDGTPILWTSDLVGPAAEPALADLTGDGLAEIIVTGYYGTFAFRHDGILLWQEDSIKSYRSSASETYGWGGPTIGNLNGDPHPEIVIAANDDALYVLDHMGNILDNDPLPGDFPTVPVLADISGDGTLDIITAQGNTLKVYEYDGLTGLEILWTYTLTNTTFRSGTFGGPAVADLTGDGQPEIIINWGPRIEAIKADGSLYWSYYTGIDQHFRPSPITVADVTGDGEINLITASAVEALFHISHHDMMVLTKEGELVWMQAVDDRTASASGVAAQDLTGDGAWEILWNGSHDGFLILRGHDGKRLFNEPFTGSGTIIEYPTLGDVDGDGVADVVLAGREGIFVISHVGHWANSRPMWNQHNYHVTNINDDWSTPVNPPNSWEVHNTYRTQTPEQNPAPSYRVEITHTVGVSNVTVLTDTFSAPPTGTPPVYAWQYQLEWYDPVNTISFDSELAGMQPGETRQINQGTEIGYRLPSGWNYLTLPPLYVTAARILDIVPAEQLVGVGSTAVYTLTLLNPGLTDDLYSLTVDGLPAGWLSYPSQVNVPAQSSVEVLLAVTAPANTELADWPFLVTVTTGSGGQDMITASLSLFNGLEIAIDPAEQTAPTGTAVTYTLTLTNYQLSTINYQLSTDGLAQVDLPESVMVAGETAVSIPITVTSGAYGPLPFSVSAQGAGGSAAASAVLNAVGHYAVGLALEPESNVAGPATPALFDLIVTNLGDTLDSYDLTLDLPAGWSASLDANGTPVDQISLPPHIFNSASLRLLVTPDVTAVPGSYEFGVTATSQSGPGVQATITGTVEVLPLGVQVSIAPQATTMSPLDNGLWQVTITNTGSMADSFALNATGIVSLTAGFSSGSVTLDPGQSQTVQMTTEPLPFALPQSYPFWVMVASQSNAQIINYDDATVTFTGYEAVEVAWLPAGQTVTDTLSASFLLVITNTGNILTDYHIDLEMPGLSGQLPFDKLPIPARAAAVLPLTVYAGGPGTYTLLATALSGQGTSASDTATLTIVFSNQPPIVDAGPDQTVVVNSLVQFNGSASDPDDDPLTFVWDFGDGNGATGTLTPTHVYTAVGLYTVTLTVSDPAGHVVSDTLEATVVPEEILEVDAGPDMEGNEGSPLAFSGAITDTAGAEPYTILWDFGDGNTAEGSLTPIHTYADNGTYTVTLTVTNSENQAASDNLVVTIHNVPPTVTAIDDQTLVVGETLAGVLAAFTDPGWLDTHTAEIDWGDGVVTAGVVDQAAQTVSGAHAYTAPGVYTVTITVTDKDGGQGSDTLTITVHQAHSIFLPFIANGG